MADARCRQQWEHTSAMLALTHNTVPGMKREDMREPQDFNPYAKAVEPEPLEVPFDTLKVLCQPAAIRSR